MLLSLPDEFVMRQENISIEDLEFYVPKAQFILVLHVFV
jgi:hypothetical protein